MSIEPKPADPTKHRLIEAAGKLFAEKGFEAASIRDICNSAQANIAAVHYHFGDKAGLYKAAISYCFAQGKNSFPDPTQHDNPAPEELLRRYIYSILCRITQTAIPEWRPGLMWREMSMPTTMFKEIEGNPIYVDFALFVDCFKKIAPDATDIAAKSAAMNMMAIIGFHGIPNNHFRGLALPDTPLSPAEWEKMASLICDFTVAGFKATITKEVF